MNIKYLTINLTDFFVGLVELFLGFRFVLKLFGANSTNGFVSWVYDMSSTLLEPFRSVFPTKVFENTYVLEFSTIFAMLIYAILGMLLLALIDAITGPDVVTKKRK
jgi:uncharacterized protein YggT (Ycf19 family)